MNTRLQEQKGQNVPGAAGWFPQTSWTLLAAARGEGGDAAAAREEFARRYYRPVHAYFAAIVRDSVEAEELTQGFFTTAVATGRLLARADQTRGSFRPYLKQALRNYVIDQQRQRKRMPEPDVRPDEGSGSWDWVPDESPTLESAFHAAWVRALLETALNRVRAICAAKGQQEHFELFMGRYLSDAGQPPAWRDLGAAFNLDEKTARSRAETVARHFRVVLRDLLVKEVGSEPGADEEIATLLALL